MYKLRKLCSGVEEYEAFLETDDGIDLAWLSSKLEEAGMAEQSLNPPQLMVVFEELHTVVRIYPSGTVHLNANSKEDAEQACRLMDQVLTSNSKV